LACTIDHLIGLSTHTNPILLHIPIPTDPPPLQQRPIRLLRTIHTPVPTLTPAITKTPLILIQHLHATRTYHHPQPHPHRPILIPTTAHTPTRITGTAQWTPLAGLGLGIIIELCREETAAAEAGRVELVGAEVPVGFAGADEDLEVRVEDGLHCAAAAYAAHVGAGGAVPRAAVFGGGGFLFEAVHARAF
jgi:hypothetical protein